jgi:hypothetical protein
MSSSKPNECVCGKWKHRVDPICTDCKKDSPSSLLHLWHKASTRKDVDQCANALRRDAKKRYDAVQPKATQQELAI